MENGKAIEVDCLSKKYGEVKALDRVSFEVGKGELFGLIGPDGAGKTTLFRLLATLISPDSGRATVDGRDIVRDYRAVRKSVGYMPGRFSLYADLTVEENLAFFSALFGTDVEESYDLIAPVYKQIEPFRKRRAGILSGGMKQKLALCCALVHRPSVLFLDEPTTGVDAVSRSEFWDMLSSLKTDMSILVSTPYMDEAERCDRVALVNAGKIMGIDTPSGIVEGFGENLYALSGGEMFGLLCAARAYRGVLCAYPFGATHHLRTSADFSLPDFLSYMAGAGFPDARAEKAEVDIEDVFIRKMENEGNSHIG